MAKKRRRLPRPLMTIDQKILHFLWKWKLSTTLFLYKACRKGASPFIVREGSLIGPLLSKGQPCGIAGFFLTEVGQIPLRQF